MVTGDRKRCTNGSSFQEDNGPLQAPVVTQVTY